MADRLLRAGGPFDQRRQGAANKVGGVMVVGNVRILVEDRALMRVRHVCFEGDQAFAAGRAEQVVEQPEQFFIGLFVEGRALEGRQDRADQVLEHLDGRHDDQRADAPLRRW